MQLILLSGGSGKRLWPLSNDARSKQFLPLLESPDGKTESMVQRVVRQIHESKLEGNITLATNETQKDCIINQLGENVNTVLEPERRDTFPAIALACSYLSLSKNCSDEEVVVVMPCDTYTDPEYFDAISNMTIAVAHQAADLVLMGIRPTYPSVKYGYIVPENSLQESIISDNQGNKIQIQKVEHFEEKPQLERAEQLLTEWAYWNGGVFAFRLGYMRQIIEKYIKATTFEEVVNHYTDFPKISFDYEVVEKATSVAVVPFSGKWKDLGTWNTLTEELHSHAIGNVILGKNNENTHVINESDLPIFCDGLKDIVVASSPDGIIVCTKKCSENIKTYANQLSKRPMYEERRWGAYQTLKTETYDDGTKYLTNSLRIKAGKYISYQVHHKRQEIWTITKGTGTVIINDKPQNIKPGDVITIKAGQKHSVKATTNLEIIEVQLGTDLAQNDIERYEWNW